MAKTVFGDFLEEKKISKSDAAAALDCTRQYVHMLAVGSFKNGPGAAMMFRIEAYARRMGGNVPVSSWEQGKKLLGLVHRQEKNARR